MTDAKRKLCRRWGGNPGPGGVIPGRARKQVPKSGHPHISLTLGLGVRHVELEAGPQLPVRYLFDTSSDANSIGAPYG
eukprot:6546910-Prymnesium_polylepis.1